MVMFLFNASDNKRLMYIKPFSAKFMVFSFFPKIVGPFYLKNYDVGLPVPKALDKKGFLHILKCHKTNLLYNAIC